MAYVYAVRVHEVEGSRARVVELCEKTGGSYVICRETDASRTHFQGWIRCELKDQALRKRLKAAFPEAVGNKGYSLTAVKDFEAYSRYVLKGTEKDIAEVVCHCGIDLSEDVLRREHKLYWDVHRKTAGKGNRAVVDEVVEWARAQAIPRHEMVDRVVERIAEVLVSRKKGCDVYRTTMYANNVLMLLDDSFKDSFCDEVKNKLNYMYNGISR